MNFILKHKGNKPPDLKMVYDILKEEKVRIIDGSLLPQLALLELDKVQLDLLTVKLSEEWILYPERTYTIPDARKKIKN